MPGPGNPKHLRRGGGRPKGRLNNTTIEVREWTRAIFEDPEVRAVLHAKAATGDLAPGIYVELMHYAFGKPKEVVELSAELHLRDPRSMTTSELEDAIIKHAEEIAQERARLVEATAHPVPRLIVAPKPS